LLDKTQVKIENPGKKKETIKKKYQKGLFQISPQYRSPEDEFMIKSY